MVISSNEFSELVNQLHKAPHDSILKQAVVQNLPKMMALAQDNPMALYHLAHVYSPNSPQYQHTMRQAANSGCTNAMLVMCRILGKSNNPRDLKKAAHYIDIIFQSNDSYIKEQTKSLLKEYPNIQKIMKDQVKVTSRSNQNNRFFSHQEIEQEEQLTDSCKNLTI